MFWISLMRVRYIWIINKANNKDSNFTFRNQEGDWSILFFVLLVMNKSRFDNYRLSYQPLLRHFYVIIVGLFVIYCILQLTQLVVLTKNALITQEVTIGNSAIEQYAVKKQMYGYKFTIDYIKKDKKKHLSFFTTRKNKQIIEKRFENEMLILCNK